MVTVLVCVALGAMVCLAGLVVHRQALRPAGMVLPWGLVLGVGRGYAVIRAVKATPVAVRGSAGCGAGWLLSVVVPHRPRTEDDLMVAVDWLGTAFVLGGMALVALAVLRSIMEART